MKRGLLCILFVVLLTVNVSAIVVSESTPVVLINEDFSKFVEGAETAPTEQDLADESTGAIDAQYTQQAGWSGMGIFQAGGICAIAPVYNYYFYEGGYLNTPKGDYSGVITYSFRARLLPFVLLPEFFVFLLLPILLVLIHLAILILFL